MKALKLLRAKFGRAGSTSRLARTPRLIALIVGLTVSASIPLHAGPLLDRIKASEPIRIGFATARPACFEGPDGKLTGFSADTLIGTLKTMGYENVEAVGIADFGSLVPGLVAGRFDIATCGLYILAERCRNVAFSDPFAEVSDVFVVPAGNPKGIETWETVVKDNVKLVYVQGTNSLKLSQEAGVDPANLMAVPSSTEMIGAILSGRVDAGHLFGWDAAEIAKNNPGKLEYTDPRKATPEDKRNWSSTAFSKADADFVALYNEAQAKFLHSPEMAALLAKYGFDETSIPADSIKADWVCSNR